MRIIIAQDHVADIKAFISAIGSNYMLEVLEDIDKVVSDCIDFSNLENEKAKDLFWRITSYHFENNERFNTGGGFFWACFGFSCKLNELFIAEGLSIIFDCLQIMVDLGIHVEYAKEIQGSIQSFEKDASVARLDRKVLHP